jgi:hypothetical protein
MDSEHFDNDPQQHCFRCGDKLPFGHGDCYLIKVEAMADPSPPVISSSELAAENLRARIERLVEQMRGISAQEAMDQVYRRLTFYLCGACYRQWIENPTG